MDHEQLLDGYLRQHALVRLKLYKDNSEVVNNIVHDMVMGGGTVTTNLLTHYGRDGLRKAVAAALDKLP